MKNIKTIFQIIIALVILALPNQSDAQTASCTGATIGGNCNNNITLVSCSSGSSLIQPDGTITCQVAQNGQYVMASFPPPPPTQNTFETNSSCNGQIINGICRTELQSAEQNCIAGTIQTATTGTRSCQVLLNGQYTTINLCIGTETTGPCRPERINLEAAMAAAQAQSLATGRQCRVEFSMFPTIDPNTGLSNGFYQTLCQGDFGYDPADYSRGVGPVTGTGSTGSGTTGSTGGTQTGGGVNYGTTGSTNAYISSMLQILNNMLETARKLYGTR